MECTLVEYEGTVIQKCFGFDSCSHREFDNLHELLDNLIAEDDTIFFMCIREQSLTPKEDLLFYRKFVPDFFKNNGDFFVIEKLRENAFTYLGSLKFSKLPADFLYVLYNYFYGLVFFVPDNNLTWAHLISGKERFIRNPTEELNNIKKGYSKLFFNKDVDGIWFEIIYIKQSDSSA